MNCCSSGDVLVIGGGVAGLEAARCLGQNGYGVHLIEKEESLGGMVRRLNQLYPEGMPNAHTLEPLIDDVKKLENVRILTSTELVGIAGEPGNYEAVLKKNGAEERIRVGAVIVATGLKSYQIERVSAYGYGRYDNVLTPVEFEEKLSKGEIDPASLKSVVIIYCAGSRDEDFLPYCSRVCCFIGLKEAKQIKDMNPDCEVYCTYMDMRSYGSLESLYNTLKDVHSVNFIRGRPSNIEQVDGKLFVITEDTLLGEKLKIPADYVIVNHGYVGDYETLEKLGIPLDTADKGLFPTTYVNASLSVDSNQRGVFVCGAAAYPKNVAETIAEARAAAIGAMDTLRSVEIKTPIAQIDSDICGELQCKLCLSVCPYDAIIEVEDEIKVVPELCMGCGICTATCASGANQLEGFTDSDIVKEIEEKVSDGDVVAFLCKWSAYPAAEPLINDGLRDVKFIKVPCTGRVSGGILMQTFKHNPKAVLVSGCYPDGCHYNKGNFMARRRIFLTQTLLEQFGISSNRLKIAWLGKNETERLRQILADMKGGN